MASFTEAFDKKWLWGIAQRRDPKYWVECAEREGFAHRANWSPWYVFRFEHSEPINYKAYWELQEKESLGLDANTFEEFVTVLSFFYPDDWQYIRKQVVLELDKIKREYDSYYLGYYKAHNKGYRHGIQANNCGHSAADDATRAYMKSMEVKGHISSGEKMANLYCNLVEKYPLTF